MDDSSIGDRPRDSPDEWQIGEIRKGIDEADRADFASDEEVGQVLERWRKKFRN